MRGLASRRRIPLFILLPAFTVPWLACGRSALDEQLRGSVAGTDPGTGGLAPVGGAIPGSGGGGGGQGATAGLRLVAGKLGGPGDLDGVGSAARFRSPWGLAIVGARQLFVTDVESHVVRQIDLDTRTVSTLAGLPDGEGSTDGVGAAARFNRPGAVTSDGRGNLYVADTGNQTIRKLVLATGAVTTLAGAVGVTGSRDGVGNAAQFMGLAGMASDGAGTLYVADCDNHAVRKIDLDTARVSTLAGSAENFGSADGVGAAAEFSCPSGLVYDRSGYLFVADSSALVIRQVEVATGAVTTVAGTARPGDVRDVPRPSALDGVGAEARFSALGEITNDGRGNLFIADGCAIRRLVVASREVTTLVGKLQECDSVDGFGPHPLVGLTGVASDGGGNLFVTSSPWGWSPTVRKIVIETGEVTTVAGSDESVGAGHADGIGAEARFSYPSAIASDRQGNVFVADEPLRKIVLSTSAVTSLPGIATRGVAADDHGGVFFAEHGGVVRKLVVATGEITTVALSAAGELDPISPPMASDGGESLFVVRGFSISRVAVSTGAVATLAGHPRAGGSSDGVGAEARFFQVEGLAADRAGNLFVADTGNHTIRKIVIATGQVTTLAGAPLAAGSTDGKAPIARFDRPAGIVCDDQGNVFVADAGNHTIRMVVLATQEVTTVVGTPHRMGVVLGPLPAGLSHPVALAIGPSGELLIADYGEHSILAARF